MSVHTTQEGFKRNWTGLSRQPKDSKGLVGEDHLLGAKVPFPVSQVCDVLSLGQTRFAASKRRFNPASLIDFPFQPQCFRLAGGRTGEHAGPGAALGCCERKNQETQSDEADELVDFGPAAK